MTTSLEEAILTEIPEAAAHDDVNKIYYIVGYYELMEENKKYILFLRESTINPG
ncbi:hypothetical protein ACFSCX_17565 [Bacillus salitolerans]|uniref:Uncharacterized protein n=1 Tax=Bacillus salitolerans TaxID=1437434 RepID=A0ABW4LT48_9BACI